MADAKLMVMYPLPKNVDAFEKIYQNEHVPLAVAKLGGKTKIVATKMLGSHQVSLRSIALLKSISHPCKLWKRARHLTAAKRRSRAPSRSLPVGAPISLVAG